MQMLTTVAVREVPHCLHEPFLLPHLDVAVGVVVVVHVVLAVGVGAAVAAVAVAAAAAPSLAQCCIPQDLYTPLHQHHLQQHKYTSHPFPLSVVVLVELELML